MKSLARLMTAVVLASAADLPAADDSASQRRERIAAIFQPFQTDRAALAPDGRHLAYELRRDERLFLVIVNLDRNEAVELPLTEDAPMPLSGVSEKVPKRLTQLLWATSTRLIGTVMDELLFGVNADGGEFKILLDSRDLEWMTESVRKRAEGMKPSPRLIPGYDVSSPGFSTQGGLSGRELTQQMREEEWARQINPAYDAQNTDEFGRPQPSVLSMHSDLGSPSQTDLFNSASTVGAVPTWRVFVADPLDDQPDQILVEIRGRASPWDDGGTLGADPAPNAYDVITALARVDPSSGKVRWSHDNFGTSRMLGDRSGKFRLALEHFNTRREYKVAMKPGAKLENLDRLLAEVGLPPATVSPANYFDVRTIPLGFDPAVNRLYVASNYERDTYGVYALDLESRQRTEIAIEHPTIDLADINEALAEGVFVFDRHQRRLVGVRVPDLRPQTLWLDAEIESLQKALAQRAPTTDFEILEWNAERTRFLLLASARSQPGAYFIYERATGELREFVQRAPWVRAALANSSQPFAFKTPAGVTLRGYLTYPREVRIEPVPILVYCHDGPWSRDQPGYDRGPQALAAMGFAVLQVNYRGSGGFGRAHRDALRTGGERVAIDDLLAAVEWVQATHAVSRRRIAILGNGYGGYLALRALQLHPDRFRCAVGINAPADLLRWMNTPATSISFSRDLRSAFFGNDKDRLRAASLTTEPELFKRPVLIVQAEGDTVVPEAQARALRRAMVGASAIEPEVYRLPAEGHARWLPGSYTRVFERLEEFFVQNIFEYTVETGETEVLED